MFSFRTTALAEQMDKALWEGNVACFCTQNSWDTAQGRYMYEIFENRGNLSALFSPRNTELCPLTNHIYFEAEQLEGLDAIVVEIQDVGVRYFNYTKDVLHLMEVLDKMGFEAPALYIVDHINPAGRVVEGTLPDNENREAHTPKVPHRHGLTLGELCNLYYNEIGASFSLHIISALAQSINKAILPWTIAPSSDIPGLFTSLMYSGGGLWNNSNITPGIGTARPYEYIGAPWINHDKIHLLPIAQGVMIRPCTFTPSAGRYVDEQCQGFQLMLESGVEYHSFLHTIQLIKYFKGAYMDFALDKNFEKKLSDKHVMDYLDDRINFQSLKEHVKEQEQKWLRKAKKFLLYEDFPFRIK